MNESIAMREARTEGRTEARLELQRDNLLDVLRARLQGDALAAAISQVEKQNDLALLSRWFKSALTLPPEAILAELSR